MVCVTAALAGCGGNLPRISEGATITVWRSLPGRGLRTGAEVVAADLKRDRDAFLRFYHRTRAVGHCDPIALERTLDARGLLIVQFRDEQHPLVELHVLQDRDGQPLTVGHGPIDVFGDPTSSARYRYRSADVAALREWLRRQVPPPRRTGRGP